MMDEDNVKALALQLMKTVRREVPEISGITVPEIVEAVNWFAARTTQLALRAMAEGDDE